MEVQRGYGGPYRVKRIQDEWRPFDDEGFFPFPCQCYRKSEMLILDTYGNVVSTDGSIMVVCLN